MDVYRSVIAETGEQVLLGTQTRRQVAQAALDRFAKKGITGFIDKSGRGWSLESYVEMAMRTGTGKAAVQGHVDRLQQYGLDLVIVSDAPKECPLCRQWEGKVLSVSGAASAVITSEMSSLGAVNSAHFVWEQAVAQGKPTAEVARAKAALDAAKRAYVASRGGQGLRPKQYPTLAEARATGLFHPGCRHSISAYQEGITRPMTGTADPEGYAATTKLRYLERQVRASKRMGAAAMDDAASGKAAQRVKDYQAKIREHVKTTSAVRVPVRERLGAR